jgi:hypothetical protein
MQRENKTIRKRKLEESEDPGPRTKETKTQPKKRDSAPQPTESAKPADAKPKTTEPSPAVA